jgi:SAM-dependent methyltransferase
VKSVLTGDDGARLLARRDAGKIADRWRELLAIELGEGFRALAAIEYWHCEATGFRWYTPAEAAGGGDLYAQLEKFDWYYMADKWEFSTALDLLGGSGSVLEVGVGDGHFLRMARDRGHAVQGVELNPQAARRVRALGFTVHEMTLQALSERTDEKVDVVCSFQVLEHVPDPRRFIEGMMAMLKPGGRLILSVPNAAVMRRIDPHNDDLLNQPPHHMGHWDEDVFRALERFMPLRVGAVAREPLAEYHVDWMVTGYLKNLLRTRLLVNRYTTLPLRWLMRMGLRRWFPGHTLLVELRYRPD